MTSYQKPWKLEQWNNMSQVVKKNQPRIIHRAKVSFKNKNPFR